MSKRMKVLVAVLAAILLLVVAGTVPIMAQDDPEPTPEPEANGLLVRVADILGIPLEDLTSAFKQAKQEIREEALLRFLDTAVEQGRLTQEEADDILEWWEQRPEATGSLLPRILGLSPLGGRPIRPEFPPMHGRRMRQGVLPMQGGPQNGPPWLAE